MNQYDKTIGFFHSLNGQFIYGFDMIKAIYDDIETDLLEAVEE
jgi:hypothetical protein